MTDNTIGVFLLVQNRLLREGLDKLLRKEADIRVIGSSACDSSLVSGVTELNASVLVVESGMLTNPDTPTCGILPEPPALHLVVIGLEPDSIHQSQLRAPTSTFVGWNAPAADVVEAVRTAGRRRAAAR